MHKEVHTQHQWRFYAVPVDPMFPLGCKTTYRAYSADQGNINIYCPQHHDLKQFQTSKL